VAKVKPVPEVLEPSKWKVKEGGGSVSVYPDATGTKTMTVPLGDNPTAAAVRRHEYCHLAYSDPAVLGPHADRLSIQACEDYRVNALGDFNGLKWGDGYGRKMIEAGIVQSLLLGQYKTAVLGMIAASGIPSCKRYAKDIARENDAPQWVMDIYERAIHMFNDEGIRFQETTIQVANWLDRKLDAEQAAEEGKDEALAKGMGELVAKGTGRSGTMRIVRHPFVKNVKTAGRKARLTDSGVIMKRPARYMTDKRMFHRKINRAGGTILIDVSGSMSLSNYDIEQMVAAKPASTIATYCGDGDSGDLTIIVKDGRSIDPDRYNPELGGNIIDLPALQWLAKQPGPRIWICDGIVTGVSDGCHPDLTAACDQVAKRAKVTRYARPSHFVAGQVATKSIKDCVGGR
jgi:hypothetical protein